MMKTKKISYSYDPKRMHLIIYEDEKLRGGFQGRAAERQFARLLETSTPSTPSTGSGAGAVGAEKPIINLTDMSESVRKAKVKRLRALWIKQGIDDYREAILEPYGVRSTADLTEEQLDELLARFNPAENPPQSEVVRRMRSHCLTLINKLGIYATNDDWSQVNRFLLDPRIAGKPLYKLNFNELETLRKKLNSIIDKQEKLTRAVGDVRMN